MKLVLDLIVGSVVVLTVIAMGGPSWAAFGFGFVTAMVLNR